MKKLSMLIAAVLFIAITLPSCRKVSGDGPIVTQKREVSGFKEIKSEISGDVYVTYGSAYEITVEAQQNILNVLETVLTGDRLTLRFKPNTHIRTHERIIVRISTPDIKALILSGSGNIQGMNLMETNRLLLNISGSGNIHLHEVNTQLLDAGISGSGSISVNGGSATDEIIEIKGSGSIDLLSLEAANSDVNISGSGNAKLNVTEHLKVKISGSGNVYYTGNPSVDEVKITGSGSLKKL
jgi:hypothetical protein